MWIFIDLYTNTMEETTRDNFLVGVCKFHMTIDDIRRVGVKIAHILLLFI